MVSFLRFNYIGQSDIEQSDIELKQSSMQFYTATTRHQLLNRCDLFFSLNFSRRQPQQVLLKISLFPHYYFYLWIVTMRQNNSKSSNKVASMRDYCSVTIQFHSFKILPPFIDSLNCCNCCLEWEWAVVHIRWINPTCPSAFAVHSYASNTQ